MPASPLSRLLLCLPLLAAIAARAQNSTPESTIVPHRYLIVYRDGSLPADAATRAESLGAHLIARHPRFGIATVETPSASISPRLSGHAAPNTQPDDDQAAMHRLASQPNVEYVLHDRIVTAHRLHTRPIADPVFSVAIGTAAFDTYYNSPQGWAVRQVGGYGNNTPGGPAHGPWDTTRGQNIRIAILDSGVDPNHPDIAPNLALNLSEVEQADLPSPCDDGSPRDQSGHGTWTASLAAGALGPGTGKVVGVAPSATLLNIKVLERLPATGSSTAALCEAGEASGLLSWVIQGIDDALSNHADILSMSLGTRIDLSTGDGAGTRAAFDRITNAAAQTGAILIAAAGNDASDLTDPRYVELPAQSRGVLAVVASTNPDCAQNTQPGASCSPGPVALAYYSNYGAPLNALAAPGGSYPPSSDDLSISGWIRGACSNGLPNTADGPPTDAAHSYGCFNLGHTAYIQAIGTSASAPLVAGAAALLRAAHPDWSAATLLNTLRSTATPATSTLAFPQVSAAAVFSQPY